MSGEYQTIKVADGEFRAYVARSSGGGKAPAVVVLQEIFGVNAVMRGMTDDLAAKGYLAICPGPVLADRAGHRHHRPDARPNGTRPSI